MPGVHLFVKGTRRGYVLKLSKFPWPRAAYDHVKNYIYIGGNLEGPSPEEKNP